MKRFLTVIFTALLTVLAVNSLWAAPPSTQARYIGFSNITASAAKASWINGNGVGRLVVISTDNTWENITTYASSNFSTTDGTVANEKQLGGSNDYVIGFTTGTTRFLNLSGLTAGTTYYVKVYEYNGIHGSYEFSTATGANNPRSFTTLAALLAPTWAATNPVVTTQNTNTVDLNWDVVSGATGYLVDVSTGTGVTFDANRLSDYTDLDIGNLTGWGLYLPVSGTYYVAIKAYDNHSTSSYSAEQTITINASMPPKFLDGDVLSLTQQGTPNFGNFDVTLTFDQELYNANDGTGALATSDFAAYAPSVASGLTDASAKVVITAITHNAGDQTVTLTLHFNNRVFNTEGFRIGPANNTSIYSVNGLISGAAGIPMDVSLDATKGGQYSADITCPDASVLNTTDNIAFTSIQNAIDANTTGASDNIQLKDNTTYSENVTVNKAVTLTDEGGGTNANVTGTWTLDGAMAAGTVAISGLTFDATSVVSESILTTEINNATISIQGNTFTGLTDGKYALKIAANNATATNAALYIGTATANTFAGTGTGVYIYKNTFVVMANNYTAITIQHNNFSGLTGKAIDFDTANDLTYLPAITITSGSNNFGGSCTGVTSKYVYSGADLASSDYLYPGVAVLNATATGLATGTGVTYNTVNAAITASANNGTQTVYLGEGTYSEAIALNEAVSLLGKGETLSGTVLTGGVVVNTSTSSGGDVKVNNLYFDSRGTALLISGLKSASSFYAEYCDFEYRAGEYAINVTDKTLDVGLGFNHNTFNKSAGLSADATATAINFADNQIFGFGWIQVNNNTFNFNSTGKDIGFYFSTSNSTANSSVDQSGYDKITINTNTFNGSGVGFNGNGDAIVFEDAVNSTFTSSAISIYVYENNFSQVGYGIKVSESANYTGNIASSLPSTITLTNAGATPNTNFTAADVYGAAWYDLTGATAVLYPSIQNAENADAAATLNIGEGTYSEDVTFAGASNLITLTGNGATCELAAGKTATLSEDLTSITGFVAPTVKIDNAAAKLDDAHALVKNNGTINVFGDITLTGDVTITKDITLNGNSDGNGVKALINGIITLNTTGANTTTIENCDWTGQGKTNCILLGATNNVSIIDNTFETADLGSAIKSNGVTIDNVTVGTNGHSNIFNFANASTNTAEKGIEVLNTEANGLTVAYNTFNMDGGSANTTVGRDYAIAVQVDNSTSGGTQITVNNNTFTTGGGALIVPNSTAAYYTYDGDNTYGFISNPVFNSNTFNNNGYAFVLVNNAGTYSLCSYIGSTMTLGTGLDANTFITGGNNLVSAYPVIGGYYTTPIATATSITPDCDAPAAFQVGSVTTVTNPVAGYWNGDNTAVTIRVPVANDASLVNGNIQLLVQVNSNGYVNLDNASTITSSDLTAGYKDITVLKATLEAADGGHFAEGVTLFFSAIITDMAGYSMTGTPSATTLLVDRVKPIATLVSATADNVINIAEKAAGFNVVAQSNEANSTLWVFETDGLGGYGFASTVGALANTSYPIAVTANSAYVLEAYNPYYIKVVDPAGNWSLASVGTFTVDLTAPAAPTNVVINGGVQINNANKTTTTLDFQYAEAASYSYTYTTSGGAGTASVTDVVPGGSPVSLNNIDLSGLQDGTVTVSVTVKDAAGNVSTAATDTELKDVVAPTAPTVVINGSNKINLSNYTSTTLEISGEVGTTYDYSYATNDGNAVTGTGALDVSPKTLTAIDLTHIVDGTVTATVTLTDAAGNISGNGTDTELKDIVAPAAFTTGAVVTTGGNVVADYWNSSNTGITVTVPLNNVDASLDGGTVLVQYAVNGGGWNDLTAAHSITNGERLAGTVDISNAAFDDALFTEGSTITFQAITTDIAGNATAGAASATTLTVDQTAPTVTLTSATADNVINIAEKAAGFNVVAQSNEATGNLYVWNTTARGGAAANATDLLTNNFGSVAVAVANTDANIAISAANANIIDANIYNVYAIDAAGNMSAPSVATFTTDLVAPQITSITSATADGTKKIGDQVVFTLNTNEAATFTANGGNADLDMSLTSGTTDALRTTDNAAGTTLDLTYTVLEGDSKTDLTYVDGAVVLSGGATWTDVAGNPVVLTTPANPNDAAAFAAAHAINIDGVPPTFTVEYHLNSVTGPSLGVNPTIGIGNNYYIKIAASESLQANPTVSIAGTTDNNVTSGSTILSDAVNHIYSFNRVVNSSNTDNGVDELITITGTDIAGNVVTAAIPTNAYTAVAAASGYQAKVDGKRPTPTISFGAAIKYTDGSSNNWTNNNPIATTIDYGEPTQNVNSGIVSITNGSLSNFVNTANTTFTLNVTPTAAGAVTVSVPVGDNTNHIQDAGGNLAYGATNTIYFDATAPTTTDNVPATWQTSDVTVTLTPNDGSGSGVAYVKYTTDGTDPSTSGTAVTLSTSPYQFTISTDGIYTIKYYAVDNVGNAETVKTATNQLKLDKTAPVIQSCMASMIFNSQCFFIDPNQLDHWGDGSHNINWDSTKVSDNLSDDAHTSLAFEYSLDGTTWNSIPSTGIYANASPLAWTVSLPANTQVNTAKVRVQATDEAGNQSAWYESVPFTLDNTPPSVTSLTVTPDNQQTGSSYSPNQALNGYAVNKTTTTITIVATFDEPMDQTLKPTLQFTNFGSIIGTVTSHTWTDATHFTWVYPVSNTTPITALCSLTVSAAKDLAQNVMNTYYTGNTVKVDQVAPTLTSAHLYSSNANPNYAKNGDNLFTDVITSEDLSNIFNGTNFYSNGTSLNNGSSGWFGNNGSNSFQNSVQVVSGGSPADPSGNVTTSITFADLAGNYTTIASDATTTGSVIIDTHAPVISNIKINGISNGNVWLNSAGTGTITFDLAEANPTQPTVSLFQSDGTTALNVATATYVSKAYTGTPGDTTYTYTVTGLTGNWTNCQIKIDETDLAGNVADQGLLSPAFNVDNQVPTATITITPNNSPSNSYSINNTTTSVTIKATFDESMDNGTAPTLALNAELDGILNDEVPNSVGWSTTTNTNDTYTWVLAINGNGLTKLDNTIDVTDAKDLAQNIMTPANLSNVMVDQVLPTITYRNAYQSSVVNTNTTDKYAKLGDVVYYEFTSSEEVTYTNPSFLEFDAVRHTGGTNTFTPYVDGLNTVYGFYGSIDAGYADGAMTFKVGVNDLAGNASNILNTTSDVIVDKTLPVIVINTPTTGDYVNGTQALTWTLTETNQSAATQAKIAGGTLTDATSGALINTLNGYSALADNTAGTITVSHTDLAGNVGTATISVNKDETAPTLTITRVAPTVGDAANFYTNQTSVQFTLTFSEPVINFDQNDITLNKTGTINTPDIAVTGTGPYTVTVGGTTAITGDGTVGITVSKANFTDRASNLMANDVTSNTFTIDQTAPTISNFTIPCDPTYQNNIGDIDFSELVYTDAHAGTPLTTGDFSVSSTGGFATLQSWTYNSTTTINSGTQTRVLINLVWSALRNGSELVSADVYNSTSVYDRAGNALVAGSPKSGNPPVPVSNIQNPSNASTCETGTATFTSSGIGVATMQWQVSSDNTNFSDITNGGVYSGATTGTLTITNPTRATYNGLYYKIKYHTNCDDFYSASAQLTVNPNTSITTQPSNTQACYSSVNNSFTVTAGGQPPVGYQWQYSADNSTWNNVVNGTPTGATYTGETSAALNVTGSIAAGTYYYKVIVNSACGPNVTSNSVTLIVNPLPNDKTVTVNDATVCYNNSTTVVVETTEVNVDYQLRVGTTPVGSIVAGTGNNISLPTGNLTSTTTFNVLATNHTSGCSVQLSATPIVTVEATPVNPTLASATPATGSTVCQGSTVSATFTAGSGGNGSDLYQYSLDNGTTWAAYTAGTNLTAGTQTIIIQGKRNATVCTSTWTTLATWNVELTPVAASLTKDPSTAAVCDGIFVRAIWADMGSGGNGNYAFDYRTSTDGGTNWTSWTTYTYSQDLTYYGTSISTTGLTNVEIRATRNATYCTAATNTVSWTVNPLPTASISGTTPACQSTLLTATTNATSAAYQWYFNASSIGGATTSTYTATQSGTYKVVVTDGVTLCSNTSADYSVTIDAMPTAYNVTGGPFCAGTNIAIGLSNSQNGYTYWLYKDAVSTGISQTGTGSALTFSVTSAVAGSYTIVATNGSCQIAMNSSVTVNPAPTANAGADASTCGTTAYTLSGTSATNYSSILWTHNGYGTLTNATTLTPTYTPAAGDIGYNVTLTMTVTALAGCTNTADQMVIHVTPPATANAGTDASICEGGTFTVSTASATNYTSLSWTSNGTGSLTNGTTLTPTYIPGVGETGTVTLTLNATGQNGCNATDNMVLTINTKPVVTITPSGSTTFCVGGSVTLTSSVGSSYLWSPGGATTQSINVTTSGDYTVTVTNANGCTNTSTATTVTVNPLPTTTITGNNSVAINTDLNLSTANAMSSYSWSATGTPTITNSTSQTATFNWTNAGDYVVTVNFTDANGCSNSTTLNVSVTASSAPVITGNPSNATSCSNGTATFAVTSVSGTPTPTLVWQVSTDNGSTWSDITGGDYTGVNSTTLNVSNLSGKNSYQYKLHAYNGISPDAYSSAATLTVTPAATPSVSIASSDLDNTFCSGTSVTFTATPSNLGGGTVAYQWELNGSNVGSNQNTYTTSTLINNDAVSCVITITNGCVTTTTATSNTITNTVNTVPAQPSAITGNTTVCAGTSGVAYSVTNVSGVTYTWSYSDNNVTIASGQGTNSITLNFASNATSGTLTVTPSNGCGNGTAQTLAITIPGVISYSAGPSNVSVTNGSNTSFSATVNNATSYQWQVSTDGSTWANATGGVYSNETTTTLSITGATTSMNGYQYKLLSSSSCETNVASTAATLTVMAAEPTTQATNIQWLGFGSNWVKLGWTNGNGSARVVLAKNGTSCAEVLTDGNTYTGNTTFGNGTAVGGAYTVYNGNQDTVSIFGLTYNQYYTFKIFEYNGTGSSANYLNSGFVSNSNPKYRKINGKIADGEISVMIGEHFLLTAISPNPVTNEVNFDIVSKEELPFTIEVYTTNGDLVYSMTKKLSAGDYPMNLKLGSEKGGASAGAYFLKVTAGGETLQQKFIYQP